MLETVLYSLGTADEYLGERWPRLDLAEVAEHSFSPASQAEVIKPQISSSLATMSVQAY